MSNFCRMFANLDISHSDSPKNVYILTQNRKRRHKLFFQFRPKSNDTIYHIFTKNFCNLKFKWWGVVTWFSSSNHRPAMAWRDWLINEIQRFVFAPRHLHQTVGSLGWLLRAIENKSVIDGGMTDALKTRRNDFKFKTDFVCRRFVRTTLAWANVSIMKFCLACWLSYQPLERKTMEKRCK